MVTVGTSPQTCYFAAAPIFRRRDLPGKFGGSCGPYRPPDRLAVDKPSKSEPHKGATRTHGSRRRVICRCKRRSRQRGIVGSTQSTYQTCTTGSPRNAYHRRRRWPGIRRIRLRSVHQGAHSRRGQPAGTDRCRGQTHRRHHRHPAKQTRRDLRGRLHSAAQMRFLPV